MHHCSDFHVNGTLQIFYDDDDDDESTEGMLHITNYILTYKLNL